MSKLGNLYILEFPNGKRYVGISINVKVRFRDHRYAAKTNQPGLLYKAIRKYGADNIIWRIVCTNTVEKIKALEITTIAQYKTTDRAFGYNRSLGGELGNLGLKYSEESRAKMSIMRKGKPSHRKGKTHSVESRAKMSAAHMGKPAPNKNKPMSVESRAKLSAAHQGKTHSMETRAKMSAARIAFSRKEKREKLLVKINKHIKLEKLYAPH